MGATLEGKVILVSGAGGGIGRATCRELAARGATLAALDTNADEGERTAQQVREGGGRALFVRTDVTESASWRSAVQGVLEQFGRLDGLFNNAGLLGPAAPIVNYPEDAFNTLLAVNVR